ncbi:MAG: ArdC family protein [Rhodopila sp.]
MNRTSTTARMENRGGESNRAPRDHYQEVTDRIIAALEAGTPPWRRPWDPDKAGGPAMRATRRPASATAASTC